MSEKTDYQQDIQIDQDSLDREFVNQPYIYMKYAELAARADKKMKMAKESMEIIAARIYRDVVDNSQKKPTDTGIKSEIALDKEYREATEEYYQLKYEYDLLASAVKALEHKRSSLENLTKLWIGGYYSTPRKTQESTEMLSDKRIERQRDRLNKRKKGEDE